MVGVLLGHVWTSTQATPAPLVRAVPPIPALPTVQAAPTPIARALPTGRARATAGPLVRMALGARDAPSADPLPGNARGFAVRVPAIVVNESAQPLVIRWLTVTGPGVSLERTSLVGALPLPIAPNEVLDLPFVLLADCGVRVRPLDKITVEVTPESGGAATAVVVRIPELDALWDSTLRPAACTH